MIPFGVNTPLWSDHAIKTRWLSVPTGQTIAFAPTGSWTFPGGTVFVKHFSMDLDEANPGTNIRRLETRVLVSARKMGELGVRSEKPVPTVEQVDKKARELESAIRVVE